MTDRRIIGVLKPPNESPPRVRFRVGQAFSDADVARGLGSEVADAMTASVLVVDDEASLCTLLSEKLSSRGFQCRTCTSGKRALELIEQEAFDAIIADLRMPEVSGLALLEEALRRSPYTAFLVFTGVDDIRVGIRAMRAGAADYLVKPLELEGVVASLERALEKRKLEIEVENYRQRLEAMVEQRTRQLETAMKRVEHTYDDTLEALGAALDLRDNETAGHSRRVTRYCREMARAMGRKGDELNQIMRGAYLHDIGKIGIPDSILLKPAKLTADEVAVMQTHSRIGYDLVSRIPFLAPAAEIVLTHQECFDGTGYPQGLVGKEIPVGSRLFAVADTLDAVTSDRPYRRAQPLSSARKVIDRWAGRQFDPEMVEAFRFIPEETWECIRQNVATLRAPRMGRADNLIQSGVKNDAGWVPVK